MANISVAKLSRLARAAGAAPDSVSKGRALEDMLAYVLGCVPGITLSARNALNVFESEELDLAFWNTQDPDGFYFLPNILLVECKNWSAAVGSQEVAWFDNKLQRRSRTHGVLVAANGITGRAEDASAAHDIIRSALAHGRHIIVLTLEDLRQLRTTDDLVLLLQRKLCELVVSGTALFP
jgi:hypothetical protein